MRIAHVLKQKTVPRPSWARHKGTRTEPQLTTTVWGLRAEYRPSTQIAKVLCGNAFVSVHLLPVSTPSLRSVGHCQQAHGTTAQYKLATSPYLNVVRNGYAQDKMQKTERQFTPKYRSRIVRSQKKTWKQLLIYLLIIGHKHIRRLYGCYLFSYCYFSSHCRHIN